MSGRTEVSSFSSIVFLIFLLSFTNANNDLFTDFISNVLVDNQFSDGFFSELLAAKYIFEHDRKYFNLGAKIQIISFEKTCNFRRENSN